MTREQARREIDSLDFYLPNHTDDYGEESHTAMIHYTNSILKEKKKALAVTLFCVMMTMRLSVMQELMLNCLNWL